ncbi:hypothetical protein IDH41_17155 [Paenibacillus sp. IB182493]|uniref:Uncharacterized protein n=1 Tax=Paenibacillus arenilitoris TaxID=2772299 RepID=A0A927CRI4_9BACL|nr:hypothetical protein [Paenibacillus arenilitoris]
MKKSYISRITVAVKEEQIMLAESKYSVIIMSSAPVLLFYPFIRKYFVKGVMIGSIKG